MKMRTILFCFLLLLVSSGIEAEVYLWPLHGPRRLSSSFGEYRDGHFHAGIDIRTFGRTGLPCLAVEGGTAVRVKIAPFGYGKALYVKLDDGSTAVYAHVDGFSRSVDSLAYSWRSEHDVSWCDLTLPADTYRFSVGDTVCFTGTTGTNAPHLHFEIRDGGGRPFNPLESVYHVPDGHPPVISGLEVVPLSPSSTVNDSPIASLFRFRAAGSQNYVLRDTLRVEGLVGIGVSLWDETGYGNYRLAPFEVELSVDGSVIYRIRNRVFDYSQSGEVALEYDIHGDGPAERYLVLYPKRGLTLEGRDGNGLLSSDPGGPEGTFRLTEGYHRLEIRARDAGGNSSRARCHLLVGRRPIIEEARVLSSGEEIIVRARNAEGGYVTASLHQSTDGGNTWSRIPLEPLGRYMRGEPGVGGSSIYRLVAGGSGGMTAERYFSLAGRAGPAGGIFGEMQLGISHGGLSLRLETSRPLTGRPSLHTSFATGTDSVTLRRVGAGKHEAVIPVDASVGGEAVILATGTDYMGGHLEAAKAFRLFGMERGREQHFYLDDTLRIGLVARRLWRNGLCLVEECSMPGAPTGGLVPVSSAFTIDYRVDRISKLRLVSDPGERVGLFRWRDGVGWKCVGVPAMEGGEITIPGPGTYAFFRDGLPPAFHVVAIEEKGSGSGFFKPFRYYVSVTETGCGVDPYTTRAFLDGDRIVCEWDEPRDRLYIPLPASHPAGPARLRVEISDRAGNSSVDEFGFVIQ